MGGGMGDPELELVGLTLTVRGIAVAVAICATRLGLLLLLCTNWATSCKRPEAEPCSLPSGDTANAVPMVITKSKLMAAILITHLRPLGGRIVRGPFLVVVRITTGWRNDVVVLLVQRGVKIAVWLSGKTLLTPRDVVRPGRLLMVPGESAGSWNGPEIAGSLVSSKSWVGLPSSGVP